MDVWTMTCEGCGVVFDDGIDAGHHEMDTGHRVGHSRRDYDVVFVGHVPGHGAFVVVGLWGGGRVFGPATYGECLQWIADPARVVSPKEGL